MKNEGEGGMLNTAWYAYTLEAAWFYLNDIVGNFKSLKSKTKICPYYTYDRNSSSHGCESKCIFFFWEERQDDGGRKRLVYCAWPFVLGCSGLIITNWPRSSLTVDRKAVWWMFSLEKNILPKKRISRIHICPESIYKFGCISGPYEKY